MSEGNVELMRRFADAWSAGDIETVIACCDPEIEVQSAFAALGTGIYRGHDGVRDWLRDLEDAWGEGFRVEIERLFDLGELTLAFSVWRGRGRHSGAEVAMQATPVARWRNGLLVHFRSFTQRDDALRELGLSEGELESAERPLPTVSANLELVRAWIEATNLSRQEDQVALAHPEFEMTEASSLPGAAHVSGREELRSYGYGWARNWSEWEWREEELIELPPDRVILESTLRLRGLRSSIWVEHRWAYLFVIRDGLILRQDGFETRKEILESLERRP